LVQPLKDIEPAKTRMAQNYVGGGYAMDNAKQGNSDQLWVIPGAPKQKKHSGPGSSGEN